MSLVLEPLKRQTRIPFPLVRVKEACQMERGSLQGYYFNLAFYCLSGFAALDFHSYLVTNFQAPPFRPGAGGPAALSSARSGDTSSALA
jgi:hypothetical protein